MDLAARAHHEAHVVLDEQDREAVVGELLQQRAERHRLGLVEPRRRLVEQQDARLARQRAGHLDEPCGSRRQRVDALVRHRLEADPAHHLVGELARIELLPGPPPAHLGRDEDVVAHGEGVEDLEPLEGAADAVARADVRLRVRDVLAVDEHLTRAGVLQAGDHVEERGLAGAVGTDQRGDVPGPHVDRHVVEHLQPAEAHRDVADLEQRHCVRIQLGDRARRGSGDHRRRRLRRRPRRPAPAWWQPSVPCPGVAHLGDRTLGVAADPDAGQAGAELDLEIDHVEVDERDREALREDDREPGEELQQQSADQRAGDHRRATDDEQQQEREPVQHLEVERARRPAGGAEQRAGEARDRRGDHEDLELGPRQVHAERGARGRAVAHGDESAAERALPQRHDDHPDDAEHERGEDEQAGVLREADPEELERLADVGPERGHVGDAATLAAEHLGLVEDHELRHARERHRRQREVEPGEPERRERHQHSERDRDQRAHDEQQGIARSEELEPEELAAGGRELERRPRADADERDLRERDLPRPPGERHERHHDQRGDAARS